MNQLIAAGGERISQAGAKVNNSYIYASQTYLINWHLEKGVQSTWALDSTVTCVASDGEILYAGTQNGTVYALRGLKSVPEAVKSLSKSITCLYVGEAVLVGCSDGCIYDLHSSQSYRPNDRFFPLAVTFNKHLNIIAIAGTSTSIYLVDVSSGASPQYTELPGHENWVRSLDFYLSDQKDLVLASAAQDRYIRLWRITKQQYDTNPLSRDLTTTVYKINDSLNCVFDALLIGHDDWVVSLKWQPTSDSASPQLLSASSDSSLIIWSSDEAQETDEEMQVWTPTVRLGDVSIMGASTATGATGGFWTAEWLSVTTVATLGRTGSWRLWELEGDCTWVSKPAITGHTRAVTGCAWLGESSLLTTSLDQTTRLWAKISSSNPGLNAFYELSRPQIHGFDMNCVVIANGQLVSAGDEKILRVFGAPTVYHQLLETHTAKAASSASSSSHNNIAAASVPALGLSNKATDTSEALDTSVLPQEAELQRLTLWPELEKIYGHGYEIVCCDVSPNGQLVASCCRANSAKHAVVRIYTADKWRQLEPLSGEHTLTITRVRFSPDSKHLLSVSRDRQWSLYDLEEMKLRTSKPKAHSRIIWDCCWLTSDTFMTVSRDKSVKIWNINGECISSANFDSAVTACDALDGRIFIGLEDGQVLELGAELEAKQKLLAEGRVNQMALGNYLAVASDTVRIFSV